MSSPISDSQLAALSADVEYFQKYGDIRNARALAANTARLLWTYKALLVRIKKLETASKQKTLFEE